MTQRANRIQPSRARAVAIQAPLPGTGMADLGEALRSFALTTLKAIAKSMGEQRQRRIERRAMAELGGLSNHQLKDIGLHRSEISSIVHGAQAWTERRRRVED